MPRTMGARDRRARAARSDRGKKRKFYRGKKVRNRRIVRFEKRRGDKKYIKLRLMERKPMSITGWRNWNRNVRRFIRPEVYLWRHRIDTPVADITTKADIEEWSLTAIGYEGYFIVFGISATFRNKWRRKWVPLFDIQITETPAGMRSRMVKNRRLFRFWFWKG